MIEEGTPRYTSLRDYLRVLREQWFVIVAITLVAVGAALYASLREDPVYQATATIIFDDETQPLSVLGGSTGTPRPRASNAPAIRARTIDEPAVLARVSRAMPAEDRLSAPVLRQAISTSLDDETFLVSATATWDDAEFAAQLADGFALEAARDANRQSRKEWAAALDRIRERRDSLIDDLPLTGAEFTILTEQMTRLRFLAENARPARLAESARVPAAPISPRTTRNVLLGGLLGLVLGIVIAFLRDVLDRRLRGARAVQKQLGYPVLGNVRSIAMGQTLHEERPETWLKPDIESLRIVWQNLQLLRRGPDAEPAAPSVIVVTSALAAEGKSTVAAGLAFASAAAGKNTLLLECDLRRPELAKRLGLRPVPGLTEALAGKSSLETFQVVPQPGTSNGTANGSPEIEGTDSPTRQNLVCVAAGTPTSQAAVLLGSAGFEAFLRRLAENYDSVIIDTTPLLPVADTLALLPLADAVVLCVRSGQTTDEVADLAKTALGHRPDDAPVGVVVTGLGRRDDHSSGYVYTTSAAEPVPD